MRKHIESLDGREVDLDNPETYSHLPSTVKELRELMLRKVGYAMLYMDHYPDRRGMYPRRRRKDVFAPLTDWQKDADPTQMVEIANTGYNQRRRVEALLRNYAEGERENYDNVLWLQEQVYLIEDETENMC